MNLETRTKRSFFVCVFHFVYCLMFKFIFFFLPSSSSFLGDTMLPPQVESLFDRLAGSRGAFRQDVCFRNIT
jgi:hypothetical protein